MYVRVGKDRGKALYAQWARAKVGEHMAGAPGGEKAVGYCEAFLSLAWLEEYTQTSLGWGSMRLVAKFITEELRDLYKKNSNDSGIKKGRGMGEGNV